MKASTRNIVCSTSFYSAVILSFLSVSYSPAALAEIYLTTHGWGANDADEYLASLLPSDVVERPDWGAPHAPLKEFMALDENVRGTLIQKSGDQSLHLRIEGEITMEDARLFVSLSKFVGTQTGNVASIKLNSKGGSVFAALTIAETIRSDPHFFNNFPPTEVVITTGDCFSACVIILAAGFRRDVSVGGEYDQPMTSIGIHRPVFSEVELAEAGYDDISIAYRDARRKLRDFFETVHVDPQLVDDMYRVPSAKIRLLTETEAESYGLIGPDLVYEERFTALSKVHCNAPLEDLRRACDDSLLPLCRKLKDGDPFGQCDGHLELALSAEDVSLYEVKQELSTCVAVRECVEKIMDNW